MEIIQLKEVGKSFGKSKILSDINLTINSGEIYGIIGQSGSGKTTLLNMIAGFLEPTEGEIVYFSRVDHSPKNLTKNINKIKKHIGYTPQHSSAYPKLTVMENLLHFGQLYGVKKETLIENANNLLRFTNLSEHKDKLVEHLSGGMQKRLDLSCSLIHKPKLLILDEPTADLDLVMQNEIIKLIKEVNKQGITILIASHQLELMEDICSDIAFVHEGRVHSAGKLDEVQRPFLKEDVIINIKITKDKEKIVAMLRHLPIKKIVDNGNHLAIYPRDTESTLLSLLRVVKEENLFLYDLDMRKPTLSEIFTKVTRGEK